MVAAYLALNAHKEPKKSNQQRLVDLSVVFIRYKKSTSMIIEHAL